MEPCSIHRSYKFFLEKPSLPRWSKGGAVVVGQLADRTRPEGRSERRGTPSQGTLGGLLAYYCRKAAAALAARQAMLTVAYAAHPGRFVCQPPRSLALPSKVWINPPADGPEPRMLQLPRDTNWAAPLCLMIASISGVLYWG